MNAKVERRDNLWFEYTMLKLFQFMLLLVKMLFDDHFPCYIFHLIKHHVQHLWND